MKLFSYYLIIWRNSTLLLDSDTLLLKDDPNDKDDLYCHKTTLIEILP
jgi:hypothetical protein